MYNSDEVKESILIVNEIQKGEEDVERIAQKLRIPIDRVLAVLNVYTSVQYGYKIEDEDLKSIVSIGEKYELDVLDFGEFSEVTKYDKEEGIIYTVDGEYTVKEFMELKGIHPFKESEDYTGGDRDSYVKTMQTYIKDLSADEKDIYCLSLGIVDGTPKTTDEIAKELGMEENDVKTKMNEISERFRD